jgi:hypothetical protein
MEELHHLRAFLAIALIGRVPHRLVALQRSDQRADVVARDSAFRAQSAVAHQEAFEHDVAGRAIHDARRDACAQCARTDLQRREVRTQQDCAAAARKRGVQVLFAFQARQLANARIGAPPADRSFEDADSETAEVLAQDALALGDWQLRQAQLQIASRDADERERQMHDDIADAAAEPDQQWKRQRLEHAQDGEREPGRPIARVDAHRRYGSPSGPGRLKRLYVQRYCSGWSRTLDSISS